MNSIKISKDALKALQILRSLKDINQGEYASKVILESIGKEYPQVLELLKIVNDERQ